MNDPQTLVEQRLQMTVPSSPPMRPPTFDSADVSYVVEDTAEGIALRRGR